MCPLFQTKLESNNEKFSRYRYTCRADRCFRPSYIVNPTEIQELSIPSALRGDDILASAQTGTGKTLSFALPIVMSLKANANKRALILSPTRELATQIMKSILSLVDDRDKSKAVLLIGGEPKTRQEKALRKQPQIIVATPGRVIDHIQSGSLMLNNTRDLY